MSCHVYSVKLCVMSRGGREGGGDGKKGRRGSRACRRGRAGDSKKIEKKLRGGGGIAGRETNRDRSRTEGKGEYQNVRTHH